MKDRTRLEAVCQGCYTIAASSASGGVLTAYCSQPV